MLSVECPGFGASGFEEEAQGDFEEVAHRDFEVEEQGDLIRKLFQSKKLLAMKFTTQHHLC